MRLKDRPIISTFNNKDPVLLNRKLSADTLTIKKNKKLVPVRKLRTGLSGAGHLPSTANGFNKDKWLVLARAL